MVGTDRKPIGVLGGMGPQASCRLYSLLTELAVAEYGADSNDSYPEVVLLSVPVPDFIGDDEKRPSTLAMLQDRLRRAEALDPVCWGISCNTVHVVIPELQPVARAPFVSMIEEVADLAVSLGVGAIGLLSTPMTRRYGLYRDALAARGMPSLDVTDEQAEAVEAVIRDVLSGQNGPAQAAVLGELGDELVRQGAGALILGCTELPLAFPRAAKPYPVIDCLEVLARTLLDIYYGRREAPARR